MSSLELTIVTVLVFAKDRIAQVCPTLLNVMLAQHDSPGSEHRQRWILLDDMNSPAQEPPHLPI